MVVLRAALRGTDTGGYAGRAATGRHTASTHLRHIFATLSTPDRVALAAVVHHSIK